MFGVASIGGRIERRASRRLSISTRDYLRKVAQADLGCAVVGTVMAVAILSHAINFELSRGYVFIALPRVTLFGLAARLTSRKRLTVTAFPEMNGFALRAVRAAGRNGSAHHDRCVRFI
jgi:hypothetical protein